jgi:alpha-amylase/alpha-mannosidase (GH57 family)
MNLAIIWHMHQPLYRQPGSHVAKLPWVRLHAVKDYLHMAQVLARYPQVHATFTLTPSLTAQLLDYASGQLTDPLMQLAGQSCFSPDDKHYLLNLCFSINEAIIRQFPRYLEILERRHLARLNLDYFSTQTWRDLLVWFNLAWTDPNLLENDPVLAGLVQKGGDFSIDDARSLMQRHVDIMAQVLPLYRQLAQTGQLELITVPYFHPILPLLVDSDSARRPSPGIPVPQPRFRAQEDARAQLQWAIQSHTGQIGQPPAGLWPSEGAVSPEMLPLVAEVGLRWLATDEAILGKSLDIYFERDESGQVLRGDLLYRPWRVTTPKGDLTLLFRDHELSDLIGFVYQRLPGAQAAEDMIVRLERIDRAFGNADDALITLILDGENAWEYYEHNGDIFLSELYRRLSEHPHLRPVTPTEHLTQHPPAQSLSHLATGSWIMGDFSTWMGDPEHVLAWSHLRDLRQAYVRWRKAQAPAPQHVRAVQSLLFAAEGSDWFWWYSHRNNSDQNALFDQLFRDYLMAAYRAMGQKAPQALLQPIAGDASQLQGPRSQLTPRLLALPDPERHWQGAALIRPAASTGAMQQAGGVITALRYANNHETLFLRVEVAAPIAHFSLVLQLDSPRGRYELHLGQTQETPFLFHLQGDARINLGPIPFAVNDSVAEFAVPLAKIGADLAQSDDTSCTLFLRSAAGTLERLPASGAAPLHWATPQRHTQMPKDKMNEAMTSR